MSIIFIVECDYWTVVWNININIVNNSILKCERIHGSVRYGKWKQLVNIGTPFKKRNGRSLIYQKEGYSKYLFYITKSLK